MKRSFSNFKMVALSCVVCISFFFTGCGSGGGNVAVVDVEKALDGASVELKLSDIASEIEYVAINMGNDFLANFRLMDLIVAENGFFLVPMPLGDTPLYKFSSDGNLVSQFDKRGRAEGEYVVPRAISYNESTDTFIISDFYNKVMVFNSNGDYLYTVPVDRLTDYDRVQEVVYIGEELVMFAENKDRSAFCAITADTAGNVLKEKVIYRYPNVEDKRLNTIVSDWGDGVRIQHLYCTDSLLTYDGTDVSVVYPLHLGKYGEGDVKKVNIGGKNLECEKFFILQVMFSPKFYDNLSPEERMNRLFYNRESGDICRIAKDNDGNEYFVNDLDGGAPFWPKTVANGKMYQLIDAIDFIEYANKSASEKMKEVAATLNENSNPVLVVVTLK